MLGKCAQRGKNALNMNIHKSLHFLHDFFLFFLYFTSTYFHPLTLNIYEFFCIYLYVVSRPTILPTTYFALPTFLIYIIATAFGTRTVTATTNNCYLQQKNMMKGGMKETERKKTTKLEERE